ncbi:twin-arginine translocase TatA/TatE family subunit [Chloroflexota bacterium]
MPHLGIPELIIILVLLFVIFGVGKLPQVGSALGKAIHELRKSSPTEEEDEKPKRKNSVKKLV